MKATGRMSGKRRENKGRIVQKRNFRCKVGKFYSKRLHKKEYAVNHNRINQLNLVICVMKRVGIENELKRRQSVLCFPYFEGN